MQTNNKTHLGRIFLDIVKKTKLIYVFLLFLVLYFGFTGLIYYFDKQAFTNFGDALWFTFVSIFTIGYGDLNVTTVMSRIFTVILVIYAAVILAMFTAIWANMISEIMHLTYKRKDKSIDIDKLNDEELIALNSKINDRLKK